MVALASKRVRLTMRVLVLSQRLPYAPNRGDRLRVYHMIQEIASHAQVDVASLVHDREEASHANDLRGIADEVITTRVPRIRNLMRGAASLIGSTPLTHVLLDSSRMLPALSQLVQHRRPDVVLAFCSSMAKFAFLPPLAGIPCVLDMIDADSAKWSALGQTSRLPLRWIYQREARLLARFEALAIRKAFATLVVNENERAALRALAPEAPIHVIENGVDLTSFAPATTNKPSSSVVFCGVMNYEPNVRGAVWLARTVWPLVRAARPDARLILVGSSPSQEVAALASETSRVMVTGTVADVKPYLWGSAVAAAPLQIARGIQNKVLEAIAAGLPCVVTRRVADGLPREVGGACRVADSAEEFSTALLDLLERSPAERRRLAFSADLSRLRWSARLRTLVPLLKYAAMCNGNMTSAEQRIEWPPAAMPPLADA
jgi:sugar transferase (PEP-CTERM/EpsH1 system associated)